MGRKRKHTDEEAARLERNRRDRETYLQKKKKKDEIRPIIQTEVAVPQSIPITEDALTEIIDFNNGGLVINEQITGEAKHGKKKTLLEKIPKEPCLLPVVPDCTYCGAKRFHMEPPQFCCGGGKVKLIETEMPTELMKLYQANNIEAYEFRQNIRSYNNMFAFTSMGVHSDKILEKINNGIYTFRIQGQVYHFMDKLIPSPGEKARNVQLYFYDTDHELENRMAISNKFRECIIEHLTKILEMNPYRAFFRSIANIEKYNEYKIHLRSNPGLDQRTFNCPTISQVAAMWTENENQGDISKHIQVYTIKGDKQIIKHYFGCYDTLQYPLIFAKGETGWHEGILRINTKNKNSTRRSTCLHEDMNIQGMTTTEEIIDAENAAINQPSNKRYKRHTVSCREYYAYKFQIRDNDKSMLLHVGRLLQQFSVDMYAKLESSRLDFYNNKQKEIRTEMLQGLIDSIEGGEFSASKVGKRIILPASFIGGPRDMKRRYMDAMTLVQKYGKPDIFLTMTCNPSWPEIKQHMRNGEEEHNRPDLTARIFHAQNCNN